MKGYEWLQRAMNGELEPRTIIITEHQAQYFDDHKEYDYYIYHKDNMFHRCNEKGQLGAKFQDRFLNYKVLNKTFSYYCVLAEEDKKIEYEDIEEFGTIKYDLGYVDFKNPEILKDWLNYDFQTIYNTLDLLIRNQKKLIDEVNKLKENKDEK